MACSQNDNVNCPLGYYPRMELVMVDGSPRFMCVCVWYSTFKDPKLELSPSAQSPLGKREDNEMAGGCKVCKCPVDSSKDPSICSQGCMQKRNGNPYCHCSTRRSLKCPMLCPYGYEEDAHGCSLCKCKPKNKLELKSNCPESRCPLNCEGAYEVLENNCPICKCKSYHTDIALKSACPPIKCDLYCVGGLAVDKNGCEICQCMFSYWQCPQIACSMECIHGYVKDANNCETCNCFPDTSLSDGGDPAGTTKG